MEKLHINNHDCYLFIEHEGQNLRIVLADPDVELACHKIKPKQLQEFISAENASLFKGRLQLKNNRGLVSVYFRNMELGIIEAQRLKP